MSNLTNLTHLTDMRVQTRFMSLVEATTNVAVGFLLALGTQVAIFPLFGLTVSITDNLSIGCIFTVVSLARSFALRRVFERLRVRAQRGEPETRSG